MKKIKSDQDATVRERGDAGAGQEGAGEDGKGELVGELD